MIPFEAHEGSLVTGRIGGCRLGVGPACESEEFQDFVLIEHLGYRPELLVRLGRVRRRGVGGLVERRVERRVRHAGVAGQTGCRDA